MMKRAETLDATESILRRAGFQISERCIARPSCFDLVARREKQVALLKVPVDVGSIYVKAASELQIISRCFSAAPLFIGEKSRDKPLEDDTVYSRYDICTINLRTLEDVVCSKRYPLVEAGPGGYYVKLDGCTIREKRQKLGLSVGKLAEMVGISRRTLYGYEKSMAKASVSVAYKLEWTLGIPLVQPIDALQKAVQSTGLLAAAKRLIVRNCFLKAVSRKLSHFGISVTPTERAPFDFIVQFPEEQLNVVGGVTDGKEQDIDQRTKEIISVSEVIEAHPILITDGQQAPNNDIPLIRYKELLRIKHPKELIDLL
jgi:putative transcriptional regulator